MRCHIQNCENEAEYSGWFKKRDMLTGKPTGLSVRIYVCEEHGHYLEGWEARNYRMEENLFDI